MASYLAEVADRRLPGDDLRRAADGVDDPQRVDRDRRSSDVTAAFAARADMISFFASQFGPFPFDVYGALVVNERTGFALETQTLSTVR